MKHILLAAGLALAAAPAAQDGCRQHYDVVTGRVYDCGDPAGEGHPYFPSWLANPAPAGPNARFGAWAGIAIDGSEGPLWGRERSPGIAYQAS